MNRMRNTILFAALFSASVALAGSNPVSVRLVLDEHLCCQVRRQVSVTVNNPGEEELQLPPLLWLVATNDAGHHEFCDGLVQYHFNAAVPDVSEYFEIRRHMEPLQ